MAIYLSLGSNLGDKLENIVAATKELMNYGRVTALSRIYETKPLDMKGENFLNCVVKYRTYLLPYDLLRVIKRIEKDIGRTKEQGHNLPRIIDVDILFYESLFINDKDLKIPHPALLERDFLLKALLDFDDEIIHPVESKSIEMIFRERFAHKTYSIVEGGEKILDTLLTG